MGASVQRSARRFAFSWSSSLHVKRVQRKNRFRPKTLETKTVNEADQNLNVGPELLGRHRPHRGEEIRDHIRVLTCQSNGHKPRLNHQLIQRPGLNPCDVIHRKWFLQLQPNQVNSVPYLCGTDAATLEPDVSSGCRTFIHSVTDQNQRKTRSGNGRVKLLPFWLHGC